MRTKKIALKIIIVIGIVNFFVFPNITKNTNLEFNDLGFNSAQAEMGGGFACWDDCTSWEDYCTPCSSGPYDSTYTEDEYCYAEYNYICYKGIGTDCTTGTAMSWSDCEGKAFAMPAETVTCF